VVDTIRKLYNLGLLVYASNLFGMVFYLANTWTGIGWFMYVYDFLVIVPTLYAFAVHIKLQDLNDVNPMLLLAMYYLFLVVHATFIVELGASAIISLLTGSFFYVLLFFTVLGFLWFYNRFYLWYVRWLEERYGLVLPFKPLLF